MIRADAWAGWCVRVALVACVACGAPRPKDPLATLARAGALPTEQEAAMQALDAVKSGEQAEAYDKQLRKMIYQPGYTQGVREQAFARLQARDVQGLKDILALNLPKMDALAWRQWLCERIAAEGWNDLTPTLVRAWAVPFPGWVDRPEDRPERKALVALHGEDKLTEVLVDLLVKSDPMKDRNLRMRCWELLQRQGQRERLVTLLASGETQADDPLLRDLRRCAKEMGILPTTREEILWLQALLTTANAIFWDEARQAVAKLPEQTRETLEIRELPIAVAAARRRPELLQASAPELYARVEARRSANGSRIAMASLEGYMTDHQETLYSQRGKLRWGDLAAMTLAMDVLEDRAIRRRLFELADRDLEDRSTEYGGLLSVKRDGSAELVECIPKVKGSDVRFEAPQVMFDQGYTGLFHFHLHAQSYDNERYAGPHIGDFTYADSTRANCLVFTFLKRRELNVDYYRHGPVVVDLGTVTRLDAGE
jgi:hypothetical protein